MRKEESLKGGRDTEYRNFETRPKFLTCSYYTVSVTGGCFKGWLCSPDLPCKQILPCFNAQKLYYFYIVNNAKAILL